MRTIELLKTTSNKILNLLPTCTIPTHIHQIQAQLIVQNLHSNTTIFHHFINACQTQNLLNSALTLLTQQDKPHVYICNNLIKAFSHSHVPQKPFYIYMHMHKDSVAPNNYTFPFLLKSFADFKEVREGKSVHAHVVKLGQFNDIYVQNSLLNLYVSCGEMGFCREVFDEMSVRDVVSWTVLINGSKLMEKYDDALIVFEKMQFAGVAPNEVTMVNVLSVCGSLGALEMGVWIHDYIRRSKWDLNVVLGTSLIDMYGKCGRIEEGINVFQSMREKNVFTWNSVIKGLALAKNAEEAVLWFYRMEQEGVKANELSLLGVLSACNHSGMVQTGKRIFEFLTNGKYGISPSIKHYACMIDLLGRAGCLEDALTLIKDMPFEPTKAMRGSLLAASRGHGDHALSVITALKLVELEPGNAAYYIVLSNLYAEMGRWNDVSAVRQLMKERGLCQDLGSSSIEIETKECELLTL